VGFATTGICPYNPHVFDDNDFASAEVTNRPEEVQETIKKLPNGRCRNFLINRIHTTNSKSNIFGAGEL
jgi:hypothetical protein